jgi:serine/threonine-protein kinase
MSLGAYELQSPLGAGGMGEVYRARDRRLGRDVAVKIIQQRLAHDSEYLARFHREAQALAALTHPNIAAVYELDEADGVVFIAMELVEGETLEHPLASGPFSIDEAVRICRQIAAALEAAHEKGIVHRDLKPANIKITPEQTVKVLDFGLAKIAGDTSSSVLTQSLPDQTEPGAVVGTIAYMSPEQSRGRHVDRRTDIWSFGCVLFRMLTNRHPFHAESVSDTIVKVLEREPDWSALPPATPSSIRNLLRRCLQKDVQNRIRDAGDVRIELEESISGIAAHAETGLAGAPSAGRGGWRQSAAWATATAIVAGAIGLWLGAARNAAPLPSRPAHFVVSLPAVQRIASLDFPAVAISRDGTRIAYVATRGGDAQLFVRTLNTLEPTPVPGTSGAAGPFFSPDGQWIAFFADGKLKKVPISGGASLVICDASVGFGGTWAQSDVIVFAPGSGSGLVSVPAAGGNPKRATILDAQKGEFSHRWPEILPDGDTVLFTVGTVGSWDDAQIVAQSLASGRRHVLVQGGTNPHYLRSGHLVYAHGSSVMAVRFDTKQLNTVGTASRLLDNVLESSDGAAQVAFSETGAIVYLPANPESGDRRLFEVSRNGGTTPLAAQPRPFSTPRLSRDGRRLLVTIAGATDDLWLYDIAQGTFRQLTFDAAATSPTWAPDNQTSTFSWNKGGPPNLFSLRVDAGGGGQRLLSGDRPQIMGGWSADGRTVAYVEIDPATGRDIWMLPDAGDQKPRPLIKSTFDETAPRLAPDGRLLAYVSTESGRSEVYVTRVDDPARARQVSTDGGSEPVWAASGRELFYRAGDQLMVATASGGSEGGPWQSRPLFEDKFDKGTLDVANYDVSSDGRRFVMVKTTERESSQQQLHVLLNWTDSLITGRSAR